MAAILWLIVILLLVVWAIGFFMASLGTIIHFVLVIAVVLVVGYFLRGIGSRGVA